MFEQTIMALLAGEFICRVSHPDLFRFLDDPDHQHEVNAYLEKIGRKMGSTSHQTGYYLTFVRCGPDERAAIREHFADIKANLAPVAGFFDTIMRATGREDLVLHGARIESNVLMALIDQDAGLRNQLQTVATLYKTVSSDGSHSSIFARVLRRLKDNGYLHLVSADRGVYQVTAKLEYLLEIVRFLEENDESVKESADATNENEKLGL